MPPGGPERRWGLPAGMLAIAVLSFPAALAEESVPAWMEACRGIADDTTRLSCYDSIPLRPADPAGAPPVEPATVEPAPLAEAPAAPANDGVEAAGAAEPPTERRGFLRRVFGRDREVSREQARESARQSEALDPIEGRVTEVVEVGYGRRRITLDDGQVWAETETRSRARYAVGDTVVISRGAFGSFNLVSERTGHRVKVRRLR